MFNNNDQGSKKYSLVKLTKNKKWKDRSVLSKISSIIEIIGAIGIVLWIVFWIVIGSAN